MNKKNNKTLIESVFERILNEKLGGEKGRGGFVDRPGYDDMRGFGLKGSDNPFLRYAPIPSAMFDLFGVTGKKREPLFPLPPAYNLQRGQQRKGGAPGIPIPLEKKTQMTQVELFRLSKLYFGNPANLSEAVWKTVMKKQSSLSSSPTEDESLEAAKEDLKSLYDTVMSALKSGVPGSFIMIIINSLNMDKSIESFGELVDGVRQAKSADMSNEKIINLMYGAFLNSNLKAMLENGRKYYIRINPAAADEYDKYWSQFAANLRPY